MPVDKEALEIWMACHLGDSEPPKRKRRKTYKKSEGSLQDEVIREAKKAGYFVIRLNSGSRKYEYRGKQYTFYAFWCHFIDRTVTAGMPDLILFKRVGNLWDVRMIEIKTEKGKLTDWQKFVFPKLKRLGFSVQIVHSLEEWAQ